MASKVMPSYIGPTTSHVLRISFEISKCTFQHISSFVSMNSVLDGQMMVPSSSCTGLFFIGPSRWPIFWSSPSLRGADHVLPSSFDVITMPHQDVTSGPTL